MTHTQASKTMLRRISKLNRFWMQLTQPNPELIKIGDKRRAQLLAGLSLVIVIVLVLGIFIRGLIDNSDEHLSAESFILLGLALFSVIAYILSRSPYFRWGSISLIAAFSLAAITNSFANSTISNAYFYLIPAFVIGCALLRTSGMASLVFINITILFLMPVYLPTIETAYPETGVLLISGLLFILVVAIRNLIERERLAEVENANLELKALQSSLEQRVAEATRDLELSSEVSQNVALLQEPSKMLNKAVNLIQERFELYYTQIYLTDAAGRNLILSAGTGDAGQALIRRGHRLAIDLGSINGIAALERRTVIVENSEENSLYRPNPLRPDTRSEMAIPMIAGERVMGVLDLQSSQVGALSAENRTAFEVLANQLAITMVNINLFSEVELARKEIETQTRRQTHEGWRKFLDGIQRKEHIGYCYENDDFTPLIEPINTKGDPESLVIPIHVLGASVGTLKFEGERPWTEDDHQTANAISHQVAQQIENLRLLAQAEQYQAKAQETLRHLTRKGWDGYQEQFAKEIGFIYQDYEVKSFSENSNGFERALKYEIKVRDEPIGELEIAGIEGLSKEDSELVIFIKEQLSAHLENLRLATQNEIALSETEEQAQQLAAINEISRGLNSAANDKEILTAVMGAAQKAGCLSATLFYIEDYPDGAPRIMTQAANWRQDGKTLMPVGYQYDLRNFPSTNLLFASPDSAQLIEDINNDERVDKVLKALWKHMGFQAIAIIPIIQSGIWLGLLTFGWSETHRFKHKEAEIYEAIISLITPTVQSHKLFEQAQTRSEELNILNEMGRTLTSLQDEQAIYETVFEYTSRLMDVNSFYIAIYDKDKHEIEFPILIESSQRIESPNKPAENGLTNHIIQTRQPLLISTDFNARVSELGIDYITIGDDAPTLSWLGIPLVFQDRIIGVVAVQSNTTPGLYTERELDLLTTISSQASVALENANAFRQTLRQAEQEATINLISQRIQSTTSVENALQVAIRELGRALGAKRTNVQLSLPNQQEKIKSGNGFHPRK